MDLNRYSFDFNSKGSITKEDVRLILSYVPFKNDYNMVYSPGSR